MTCLKAPNFPWPRSDECKVKRPSGESLSRDPRPQGQNELDHSLSTPCLLYLSGLKFILCPKISFSWNRKLLFSWCQVHFGPKHRECSSPAVVYNRTVLDLKAGLQFNEQVYIGPEYTGRLSNVSYSHLTRHTSGSLPELMDVVNDERKVKT